MAFVREMNERLPRGGDENRGRFQDLSVAVEGSGRGSSLRIADADARRILDHYRESNQRTVARAANRADFTDDYFDAPVSDDPGNVNETIDLDEALDFARMLWAHASELDRGLRASTRAAERA